MRNRPTRPKQPKFQDPQRTELFSLRVAWLVNSLQISHISTVSRNGTAKYALPHLTEIAKPSLRKTL